MYARLSDFIVAFVKDISSAIVRAMSESNHRERNQANAQVYCNKTAENKSEYIEVLLRKRDENRK